MGRRTVPVWAFEHLRTHLPSGVQLLNVSRHARRVVIANTSQGAVVVTKGPFGPPRIQVLTNPRERLQVTCACGMRTEFRRESPPPKAHCSQCGQALHLPQRATPSTHPDGGEDGQPVQLSRAVGAPPTDTTTAPTRPAGAAERAPRGAGVGVPTARQARAALASARTTAGDDPQSIRTTLQRTLSDPAMTAAPGAPVEREMARLREMKRTFVNAAAHELRTPMTPLLLSLRTLELQGPDAGGETIRHAVRNAKRLEDVVERLVKVSQVQATGMPVHTGPLDLRALVRAGTAAWQARADAAGIHLALWTPPRLRAHADGARVLELLDHLLSNALRFTPAGGRIRVALRRRAGRVDLSVTDTGQGIPTHERARVTDPFVQLEAAALQTEAGLGLGLFFAKAITEGHGGALQVLTGPRGKGTRIVATWPSRGPARVPPADAGIASDPSGGGPADVRRRPADSGAPLTAPLRETRVPTVALGPRRTIPPATRRTRP